VDFDLSGGGSINIFGLGGKSSNDFQAKEPGEIEEDKDKYTIRYDAETFAVGLNYNQPLGRKGNLFFAVGYSSSENTRHQQLVTSVPGPYLQLVHDDLQQMKEILSAHVSVDLKPAKPLRLTLGMIANQQNDVLRNERSFDTETHDMLILGGDVQGTILQPYIDTRWIISPALTAFAGLRYLRYGYNNSNALEPRISLGFSLNEKNTINLAYRLTSQTQHVLMYALGSRRDLDLTKSHHAELGHTFRMSESASLKTDIFYQHIFEAAMGFNPSFSGINLTEISGIFGLNFYLERLYTGSKGNNYGVNVTAEKSFYGDHFFILGGSLYRSTYSVFDSVHRPSRFDGRFTLTATWGKEWRNPEKKRTIGVNTRVLYLGGLREQNVLTQYSTGGEPFYDPNSFFTNKLKNYYRADLRVSFRKDKAGYTRTLAVDIQNVTGAKNEAYHYFDGTKNEVVTRYQLGIIPVLVYRVDF
jgi:hypothetical protein